ncbi:hypothetical protein [Rhodohalobacter sulfatireducens]|uniref:PLAT domain-containing protein n=1 Tax=Rhodohalobacter sulfatireducens TaxID=2911366 RepID=A0ABS9K9Q8_9BACT|nr:hypothetical protein [Rhodohalobacter sulfatireducens]MCG2587589.1 hypothetical protein [Rhodohalobacter sulfatireducens]
MKYVYLNLFESSTIKSFIILIAFGLITSMFSGCSSSTSANDEDGDPENETRTFELVLSSDGSTNVGTATTEIITPDSDAYIDEGFFITLDISAGDFEAPFDVSMRGGQCGTWDVQVDEKAEMPCDYDEFLADPSDLKVTSEDGSGVEAYAEGS